jgi:hypothetical protein
MKVGAVARGLGMSTDTLVGWLARKETQPKARLRRVVVPPPSAMIAITLPSGARIENLDPSLAIEIAKELC